jgi:transcriptional regulator with XRE-family HTH domain
MAKKTGYIPVVLDTERIKSLREGAGLTMQQAAVKAGENRRQWWNNIESGIQTNIQLDTLNKIAAALGVPAKELLR